MVCPLCVRGGEVFFTALEEEVICLLKHRTPTKQNKTQQKKIREEIAREEGQE